MTASPPVFGADRDGASQTTELVLPGQTNHHGTLFGGEAMRLLDATAFIAATRYARRPLVTARSERLDFASPVCVGDLLDVRAEVVETRATCWWSKPMQSSRIRSPAPGADARAGGS